MKLVLDTYAWIEYFRGTKEGEEVRKYLEDGNEIILPSIVVAELHDKYTRNDMESKWQKRKKFLNLKSEVHSLDFKIAENASELKWALREEHDDVGLADAIILSHAVSEGAQLLTGDKHLTHRDEVINIKSNS